MSKVLRKTMPKKLILNVSSLTNQWILVHQKPVMRILVLFSLRMQRNRKLSKYNFAQIKLQPDLEPFGKSTLVDPMILANWKFISLTKPDKDSENYKPFLIIIHSCLLFLLLVGEELENQPWHHYSLETLLYLM